jgi:diguanylate cyclase (GGDEF)-like protein
MDQALQTRIDGRFRVIDRAFDPSATHAVGDEHPLQHTWCRHTLRANGAFGVSDVRTSDHRDARCARAFPEVQAYLGAPLYVDAVRMGTLALTSDKPRARFTESDLVLMGLLTQWVGQELARQQDGERYEKAREELNRIARTDVLTGLPNRRALLEALHWQVAYARRARHSLSVVLCDLDHFKSVNDTYGHEGGDRALQAFADACRKVKRETDLCGRWGGEEFLVVLPDTDIDGARVFCDRLLQTVREMSVQMPCGTAAPLRVSLGVARLWSSEHEGAALARADAALYRAKAAGRDRAVIDEGATPAVAVRSVFPAPG